MSKVEEQKKISPDMEQILSERDALKGMLEVADDQLMAAMQDKKTLFVFTHLIAAMSVINLEALRQSFDALTAIGMGPQLDDLNDLLRSIGSCDCDSCNELKGIEAGPDIAANMALVNQC